MAEKVNVYEIITTRILDLLEKGVVPWRKGWKGGLSSSSGLPRNIRGTAYRGINVWLLTALGYDSPYFLTYKQAVALGGKVKKGEKGMSVILWQPFEGTTTDEQGNMKKKKFLTLRYYTVFNVEQTEGCKFPKRVAASLEPKAIEPVDTTETGFDPIAEAEAIFEGYQNRPEVVYDGNGRAYYVPSTDVIHLPKKEDFVGNGEYYSTLFHEINHSTGHKDRLNREQKNFFGDHLYGVEELTAEFGAAFLNSIAGLPQAVIENSAAYIASWKATIKADPKLVITAAAKAQKSVDLILGRTIEAENIEVVEVPA